MSAIPHTAYDVFLSYAREDRAHVEAVARQLRESGIEAFLDLWYLTSGEPWQAALEKAMASCRSVAVFVGPGGLSGWQRRESDLALYRQQQNGPAVIPVLLPHSKPVSGFLALNTWVDMRSGVDDLIALETLVTGIRGRPPSQQALDHAREVRASVSPYRGLASFREEDAPFFFGRAVFVDRLVGMIANHSMVAVVGPSGGGKSSVVRAGLVPRLRSEDRDHGTEIAVFMPGVHPLERLAGALVPLLEPEMNEIDRLAGTSVLAAHLRDGTVPLRTVVARVLEKQPGSDRLALVVDQWEELYSQCHDAPERDAFVGQLLDAADGRKLVVILTIRGAFYGDALRTRALADRLQGAVVNLSSMSRDEIREAIVEPATLVGLEFERGLVDRILLDVGDEPGNLPLLEFLLLELWRNRHGSMLLHSVYDDIGGVEGAIATRANRTVARMPGKEANLRRIFVRLVQTGVNIEDTRRRVPMADLSGAEREIVRDLADERLLVTYRDQTSQVETVEVAHEALIRNWDRLGRWLDSDREFLLWRERLRSGVDDWKHSGKESEALLRGARLAEAERWRSSRADDLNNSEAEFIESSIANQAAEDDAQHRRRAVANAQTAALIPVRAFIALAVVSCLTLSLLVPVLARCGPDECTDLPQGVVDTVVVFLGYLATLYTPVVLLMALYSLSIWIDRVEDVYDVDRPSSRWFRIWTGVLPFGRVSTLCECTADGAGALHEKSLHLFVWRVLWLTGLMLAVIEDIGWFQHRFRVEEHNLFAAITAVRTIIAIVVALLTVRIIRRLSTALPSDDSRTPRAETTDSGPSVNLDIDTTRGRTVGG